MNRAALWPILEQAFLQRGADEWVPTLEQNGVPVGLVNTLDRVVSDPQINSRQMVLDLTAPDGRRVRAMGNPLVMRETQRMEHTFPPAAGENSRNVLAEVLAMDGDEIAQLLSSNVVRARN